MNNSIPDTELINVLAKAEPAKRWRLLRWILLLLLLILAAASFIWFRASAHLETAPQFQTEALAQGQLRVTVSATGKLAPINQVDVGSELSGTIETVLVDHNDRVTKGQVIARLDVAKLENQVAKSKAALSSAEAKVLQAAATLRETKANIERLRQMAKISTSRVVTPAELESAEASFDRAMADQAGAQAAVAEARATLRSAETDLNKASIRSPIDGVVLQRKVEPGQTVAASLQAPVLFVLAENLAQMELQVDVDEADVGQVRDGQSAIFTVDAYPNRSYPATIRQVRFGAETVNNVVTYKTILNVANDDLSLRPGMTATAEILVSERENVLLIPNAALRFTPPTTETTQPKEGLVASLLPRPPRLPNLRRTTPVGKNKRSANRQIWVLRDTQPQALEVTIGASDGRMTEVQGAGLTVGMPVIISSISSGQK